MDMPILIVGNNSKQSKMLLLPSINVDVCANTSGQGVKRLLTDSLTGLPAILVATSSFKLGAGTTDATMLTD